MRADNSQDTGKCHGHPNDIGHVGIEVGCAGINAVPAENQQGDDPGHGFPKHLENVSGLEFIVFRLRRSLIRFCIEEKQYHRGKNTCRALHIDNAFQAGNLIGRIQAVHQQPERRYCRREQTDAGIEKSVQLTLLFCASKQAYGLDYPGPECKGCGKCQQYPYNHGRIIRHVHGKYEIQHARAKQREYNDPLGAEFIRNPAAGYVQTQVHDRVNGKQETGLLIAAIHAGQQLIIKNIFYIGQHVTGGVAQRQGKYNKILSEKTHSQFPFP